MKRVLLLHPAVGYMDSLRTAPAPPLNLIHAATLLLPRYEVRIVDQRKDPDWKRAIEQALGPATILVGITTHTGPMISSALEMAGWVRGLANVPIVWGGPHPTLLPEQTVAHPLVDYVIQGEGEEPLPALARALEGDGRIEDVPSLWWKEGNGRVRNGPPGTLPDLSALPDPPFHLVDLKEYLPEYQGRPTLFFQTSRGCPFSCAYCFNSRNNAKRWRAVPNERAIGLLKKLSASTGCDSIYFVDDNQFVDLDRARAFCEALCDLRFTWGTQGIEIRSLRKMTDDDLRLLVRSGCRRITIGIESGSPRIRALMRKEGDVGEVIETIERLKGYPFTIYCSFMSGLPTETSQDLRMTLRLIEDLLRRNPNVRSSPLYNYTPYPGTDLFELSRSMGFRPPETLEGWRGFSYEKCHLGNGIKPRTFESLYFLTLFLDSKSQDYEPPRWIQWSAALYRPIARLRMRTGFFGLMPERHLLPLISSLGGRGWLRGRARRKGSPSSAKSAGPAHPESGRGSS